MKKQIFGPLGYIDHEIEDVTDVPERIGQRPLSERLGRLLRIVSLATQWLQPPSATTYSRTSGTT